VDKAGEEQGELVLTALVRSGRLVVGQCGATVGGYCSQDGGVLVVVLMFFSVPYTYYIYIYTVYIYIL
jgi:hypothetical protein